ncbi:MAG TPA: FKBP-type peptidyl-prolyl cis-trans isomerase [Chitinophagaceae bacterium]
MRNLFAVVAVLMVVSCNTSYEKTKSGLRYKIFKAKGGEKLKPGDFVKINQEVLIPERDTVLFSTHGKMPAYTKVDTSVVTEYRIEEILPKMSVGDSAVIVFSVDSMKNRGFINEYNETFRRGGQITFRIRVLKRYATEKDVDADFQKDFAVEKERRTKEAEEKNKAEVKALTDYLAKNNIKAIRTPSGAYVEVQEPGTGKIGDTSAVAMVHYTGKLFKDGSTFQSNMDQQPFPVEIGGGATIRGFDEGLMYFGKGGKGRIYIPSHLAYGENGQPPVIPPGATLLFEIRIADIKPKGTVNVPPVHVPQQ